MNRFYKIGKCDWCHRHGLKVFLTTFESDVNKHMCDRCKGIIEHQREVRDGIPNGVDLWDETAPNFPRKVPEQPEVYGLYKRPKKFVIDQTRDKTVTLYGFKNEDRWVVEFYNERTLNIDKLRIWEYTHLGPAKRRYFSCAEGHDG